MLRTVSPLRRIPIALAALALAGAGVTACGSESSTDATGGAPSGTDAPLVVATTTQLADFARVVGGDDVEVYSLLTPNSDAHDFEPAPRDLDALARADVIVANGLEFEPWLDAAVEASGSDAEVIDTSEGANLLEGAHDHDHGGDDHDHAHEDDEGHDHDHEGEDHDHAHEDDEGHDHEGEDHDHDHDHEGEGEDHDHAHEDEEVDDAGTEAAEPDVTSEAADDGDHDGHDHDGEWNPHLWLDPANAKVMVGHVADAIVAVAPDAEDDVRSRTDDYLAELDELDEWIEAELADLSSRDLVTDHDAFPYYIDRYDLVFVGSIIPSFDSSAEISAGDLNELADEIAERGVLAIFTEQSLPANAAEALARQTGVEVVSGDEGLYGDALGPEGSPGETYLGMMRHNTTVIATYLA